jgi:hypothetical protein
MNRSPFSRYLIPLAFIGVLAFIGGFKVTSVKSERSNIIETGNFESGFTPFDREGNSLLVSSPVRAGKYAARFDLSKGNVRNEVAGKRASVGGTYWYGWSLFVPNDYVTARGKEFVTQFLKWQSHEPKWTGPGNCLLKTENGRWKFKINYQKSPTTKSIKSTTVDLGPYKRGKWTDWVMHVKWSYKSDGFLRLYKDGKLVFSKDGATYFNIPKGPYFKMGIYVGKNNKNWSKHRKLTSRTIYGDEYRMGNAKATYKDVAPRED